MAVEPVDALIVAAGASGGLFAKRLTEAGIHLDWGLIARKQCATSPNLRGVRDDYRIVEDDSRATGLSKSTNTYSKRSLLTGPAGPERISSGSYGGGS